MLHQFLAVLATALLGLIIATHQATILLDSARRIALSQVRVGCVKGYVFCSLYCTGNYESHKHSLVDLGMRLRR